MKTLNNRFYVKFMQLEKGLLAFSLNTNQSRRTSTVAMATLLLKSAWYNFG